MPPPAREPSDRLQQSLPTVLHHAPRPAEKRLGPWELLSELGRGSNGVVFRARRAGLAQEVALKVLPDALRADPEAVQRFRQEAELGRRLDHPGLVKTLDMGDAGAHAWYAMELVPGETLAARLRRGKLPIAEATALVLGLARAMAHAHAQRVVHRDLKPANVILSSAGPRITDLGLARDQERVRALTRTGDLLGTPLYMAPEQLQGVRGVDARVDVWALGVLLFECVTGDRPFHASDPLGLARVISHEDAPALRLVAPNASPALEAVVRRALARAPDERFPDAGALAAALEPLVAAPPAPSKDDDARPPSGSDSTPRAAQGVGVPVAIGACVVALVAAGAAVVVARRAPAPAPLVATEPPPPSAPARDPALVAALEALLAAATAEPRAAEDARTRALAAAGPAGRDEVEAACRTAAAAALDAVVGLARDGAPLERLLARVDAARALAPGDGPTLRRADLVQVRHLHRRARYAEAAAAARALLAPDAPVDATRAEALAILARSPAEEGGDPPAMRRLAAEAPEPWRSWATAEVALLAVRSVTDLLRVQELARAALAHDPAFAPAHELLGRTCRQVARARRSTAELDQAEEALRAAREAAPDDVHVDLTRALVRFDRQDYEGKVELLTRAIALSEPSPQRTALFWRGHTLYALHRHGEARRDLERLVQLRPDDVEAALWRALLWSLTSEVPRAQAEWRRLVHTYPVQVDAVLGGQSSVETQPVMEGVGRALVEGARRADTPASTPRGALAARLGEVASRSGALAPWEDVSEALARAEAAAAEQGRDGRDLAALERARACFRRGRVGEVREVAARIAAPGGARREALEARLLEGLSWTWGGDPSRGLALLRALHDDDEGPVGCAAGLTWNSSEGRSLLAALLGRAALAVDPLAVEAAVGMASALSDLGQGDDALLQIDEVLRRVPDHPRALVTRATLIGRLGRSDEALAALDLVVRLSEPAPFARVLGQRASLRLFLAAAPGSAKAQLDEALADAERGVALAPREPYALSVRAMVREALGRRDDAAADLRAAREVDPDGLLRWLARLDPQLRERLSDLIR